MEILSQNTLICQNCNTPTILPASVKTGYTVIRDDGTEEHHDWSCLKCGETLNRETTK